MILYNTHLFPVSGVTIVAGGAALVAGGALAATSTITTGLSLLIGEMRSNINTGWYRSILGGGAAAAAAVGGNMVAQEMCLGEQHYIQ